MANRQPAYRPRKPSEPPSPSSLAERDAFTALAHQSLQQVQASAEAWRNGLTAFLTLITTAVIIKGRDTTAGLATSWRILITVLIGGGLALAVAGLWQVLAAQAGTRYRLSTRQDIHRTYHTIEAYHVALADQATNHLDTGRRLVLTALMFLLTGIGVSWWAPPPQPTHPPPRRSVPTTPAPPTRRTQPTTASSGRPEPPCGPTVSRLGRTQVRRPRVRVAPRFGAGASSHTRATQGGQ
jgi:hypothetical protein